MWPLRFLEHLLFLQKKTLILATYSEFLFCSDQSCRFAKGQSETMQTLRGLQAKGVKVDLGIPDDMWERPSAPVTKMKQHVSVVIHVVWFIFMRVCLSFCLFVCLCFRDVIFLFLLDNTKRPVSKVAQR